MYLCPHKYIKDCEALRYYSILPGIDLLSPPLLESQSRTQTGYYMDILFIISVKLDAMRFQNQYNSTYQGLVHPVKLSYSG